MPAPRINLALLSPEVRANLERLQGGQDNSLPSPKPTPSKVAEAVDKKPKKGCRQKKTLTPEMSGDLVQSVVVSQDTNEVKIVLAVDASSIPTAQGKGAFVDKGGHVHFFTKPKQRKAEQAFQDALEPYAYLTRRWGEVPIELEFKIFFAYPSGTPKKHQHKIGPHIARPDCDNICKGPLDSMTRAGFWPDDSYINSYHIYKRRSTGPACIVIKITNLQPKFDALYRATEEQEAPTLFATDRKPPEETNPLSELSATKPF